MEIAAGTPPAGRYFVSLVFDSNPGPVEMPVGDVTLTR